MSERRGRQLNREELGELPGEIERFFRTYYQELRNLIAYHEASSEDIPEHLRGYKNVVAELGTDGIVIAHFRNEESEEDTFVFEYVNQGRQVKDILASMSPRTSRGQTISYLDYPTGADFGAMIHSAPAVITEDDTTYETLWTRLEWASAVNFHLWQDEEEARRQARQDFEEASFQDSS